MTEGLHTYLGSDTVRAGVDAAGWEQAVERVGALLVEAGSVEPRYVEAMQATIAEHGAYAVIAPGIALPHARPEQGVLRPGLALVTLAEAVEFGHSVNDPVDVVIAFAAVDKAMHVKALQELATLLADADAVERIRAAASDDELLAALEGSHEHGPDDDGPPGPGR